MMGDELRKARERAGLTQEALSFRAGVSCPYISQARAQPEVADGGHAVLALRRARRPGGRHRQTGRCREEAEGGSMSPGGDPGATESAAARGWRDTARLLPSGETDLERYVASRRR
jgi:hypothetical protein